MTRSAEQLTFPEPESNAPVHSVTKIRCFLDEVAGTHVSDALADYMPQEKREELGLTQEQVAFFGEAARYIVREFAWDVHSGDISLDPDTTEEGA